MRDVADRAQGAIDALTEAAILNIKSRSTGTLAFKGTCYFCDSEVQEPLLFCNADCRDDWQNEQKIMRIRGR